MIHINKSQEPRELSIFNKTRHQNWKEIHVMPNKYAYKACLQQCLTDQNNLCGYSEIKLDGAEQSHIDHYIKRDLAPQLTFRWSNMVAAVKDQRFGANFKDKNIHLAAYDKLNQTYANAYNPIADDMVDVFVFSADGGIEPSNKADARAIGTIILFNLNDNELKSRRRECMEAVRSLRKGGLSNEEIYESLSSDGFISVLQYELKQSE